MIWADLGQCIKETNENHKKNKIVEQTYLKKGNTEYEY